MYPTYSSMKIIHDQNIQESLEQQSFDIGQEEQRQSPFQKFGRFLAGVTAQLTGNKEEILPCEAQASPER